MIMTNLKVIKNLKEGETLFLSIDKKTTIHIISDGAPAPKYIGKFFAGLEKENGKIISFPFRITHSEYNSLWNERNK